MLQAVSATVPPSLLLHTVFRTRLSSILSHPFSPLSLSLAGPQYWHASRDENIAYIKDAIAAVQARGVPVAVYTSESQWDPITGNADIASHLPLWVRMTSCSRLGGCCRMSLRIALGHCTPVVCCAATPPPTIALSSSSTIVTIVDPRRRNALVTPQYAHYDNSRSFGDFRPFAGWSKPSIKQYAGDATVCGAGVDLNWYP